MMALAIQVTGAVVGFGIAFAAIIGPELAPVQPIHIECTDAQVMQTPDSNMVLIDLTCHAGEAPVVLTVPEIQPSPL